MKGQQLPLSVQLRETPSFDSFVAGPNALALSSLQSLARPAQHTAPRAALLYGATGSGRTHLLQALARAANAAGARAVYLPLSSLRDRDPAIIDGFERMQVVALDDVDAVFDDAPWTLAVLRLLDALRSGHAVWVVAANQAAEHLDCALPDLRTRLSSAASLPLKPLGDEHRAELLRRCARLRGLQLSDDAVRWMLTHLPRDNARLVAAIETLDHASLSAQRRLTGRFVQQTLAPA